MGEASSAVQGLPPPRRTSAVLIRSLLYSTPTTFAYLLLVLAATATAVVNLITELVHRCPGGHGLTQESHDPSLERLCALLLPLLLAGRSASERARRGTRLLLRRSLLRHQTRPLLEGIVL